MRLEMENLNFLEVFIEVRIQDLLMQRNDLLQKERKWGDNTPKSIEMIDKAVCKYSDLRNEIRRVKGQIN